MNRCIYFKNENENYIDEISASTGMNINKTVNYLVELGYATIKGNCTEYELPTVYERIRELENVRCNK